MVPPLISHIGVTEMTALETLTFAILNTIEAAAMQGAGDERREAIDTIEHLIAAYRKDTTPAKAADPKRLAQCAQARLAVKFINRRRDADITPKERVAIYALAYKGYDADQIMRGFICPAVA